MSAEEAAGLHRSKPNRPIAAAWCHSFASNSTSNSEDTSHERFYVPLAPPHPQRCPVSEWSNDSPEIISSHAWCVFCQENVSGRQDANANTPITLCKAALQKRFPRKNSKTKTNDENGHDGILMIQTVRALSKCDVRRESCK